jgi:hypothetical protein
MREEPFKLDDYPQMIIQIDVIIYITENQRDIN